MTSSALRSRLLAALADVARAARDFLRGFTGLATAPRAMDAAARRQLEEAAERRPRCC
jgi:hypothetical protein